jgi:enterochelin esterase family protein
MGSSQIRADIFRSRVLEGNALGDPVERVVHVYLPTAYSEGIQRFPVVFLLAGFTGTGAKFMNFEAWEEDIQQRMNRLVSSGRVRPMVLIMPDALTRFGGSQYINSSATGRYQDYLLELVDWADHSFRTLARREARAIAGKSSGGFGAVTMAMDHPESFGLVGDHSGDKYFEYCYLPELPRMQRAVEAQGDLEPLLADPRRARPHDQAFAHVMELAAMSSCYSPNPEARHGFDFPIDPATGAFRPEVWARWKEHDPVDRLPAGAEALRSLRLLYMDCGDLDEYYLNVGMRLFHLELESRSIPHVYETYIGGHFRMNDRLDCSLEAFSRAVS